MFDALEWLAAMPACACRTCLRATHRQAQTGALMSPPKAGKPNKGEQMAHYYGYYSNVSRGKQEKNAGEWILFIPEEAGSSKERQKNWARLIQKK